MSFSVVNCNIQFSWRQQMFCPKDDSADFVGGFAEGLG